MWKWIKSRFTLGSWFNAVLTLKLMRNFYSKVDCNWIFTSRVMIQVRVSIYKLIQSQDWKSSFILDLMHALPQKLINNILLKSWLQYWICIWEMILNEFSLKMWIFKSRFLLHCWFNADVIENWWEHLYSKIDYNWNFSWAMIPSAFQLEDTFSFDSKMFTRKNLVSMHLLTQKLHIQLKFGSSMEFENW